MEVTRKSCKPSPKRRVLGQSVASKLQTADGPEVRRGYLYRYWSDSGTLLYIGISINAVARLGQHKGQAWFPRIATITVQKFDTYEEAEIAELKAICYEGPIHNIKGPRDAKDLGPALSRLRGSQRRSADRKLWRERCRREIDEIDWASP